MPSGVFAGATRRCRSSCSAPCPPNWNGACCRTSCNWPSAISPAARRRWTTGRCSPSASACTAGASTRCSPARQSRPAAWRTATGCCPLPLRRRRRALAVPRQQRALRAGRGPPGLRPLRRPPGLPARAYRRALGGARRLARAARQVGFHRAVSSGQPSRPSRQRGAEGLRRRSAGRVRRVTRRVPCTC